MAKLNSSDKHKQDEIVILVHGIFSSRLVMRILERRLQRLGYTTLNWSYPSAIGSLEKHAKQFRLLIEEYSLSETRVHIVAHSMGAIVARLAISYGPLCNLGRVVLLAPPNLGSPVARILGPLFWPICPAVSQLSSHPNSFVNQLEESHDFKVGIISAQFDILVPFRNTPLDTQSEFICLAATHNSLLFQKNVVEHIDSFLSNATFRIFS